MAGTKFDICNYNQGHDLLGVTAKFMFQRHSLFDSFHILEDVFSEWVSSLAATYVDNPFV